MIREETIAFSGLPLEVAVSRLHERGIEPQIRFTRAPRGTQNACTHPRVLCASENGRVLTAAYFADAAEKDKV